LKPSQGRTNLFLCVFAVPSPPTILVEIMGTPEKPEAVRLFAGIMFDKQFGVGRVLDELEDRFGPAESVYGPVPFAWSDYYAGEMGGTLLKTYVCYGKLADRDTLPDIKLWTNDIEQRHAEAGRRKVNIDPGYLARDKLALATTKDFYHRLFLRSGIYGEVTLHFRQGRFRHFSWTYPDYREEMFHEFLIKARADLVGELRKTT
jgi:hypothetical protein